MNPSKILFVYLLIISILSCKKNDNVAEINNDDINQTIETRNGITYKVFVKNNVADFKGILVMGSGNDENHPSPGSMEGAPENDLCKRAAQGNYVAAIVQYRKTPGLADWNASAKMIGDDYDKCINALATKYSIDKNRSVIGGYSYASFMLLTYTADYAGLAYCKGLLAACGSTQSTYFHLPVYSIVCSGNNEGDLAGKALFDAIPNSSPFKILSEGITDNSCNSHCGGNWTDKLYAKMVSWLQ